LTALTLLLSNVTVFLCSPVIVSPTRGSSAAERERAPAE
jgi:hypothetical protein